MKDVHGRCSHMLKFFEIVTYDCLESQKSIIDYLSNIKNKFSFAPTMNLLTDLEDRNTTIQSLIYIFQELNNVPTQIGELSSRYIDLKDGIHHRTSKSCDRDSGVRTCIALWDSIARKNSLGKHDIGKDGCKNDKYHRVCRKKVTGQKTLYWINNDLAPNIGAVPPCGRVKYFKNAFINRHCQTFVDTAFKVDTAVKVDTVKESTLVKIDTKLDFNVFDNTFDDLLDLLDTCPDMLPNISW
jgi:hypothetical protein